MLALIRRFANVDNCDVPYCSGLKADLSVISSFESALPVTPGLTRGPASSHFPAIAEGLGVWVYIMADRYRGAMYVGVTTHLAARIQQHRGGGGSDFCRRYGLERLVWAERAGSVAEGIAHEKRLKRWRREWKFALIERGNPEWVDLFDLLG